MICEQVLDDSYVAPLLCGQLIVIWCTSCVSNVRPLDDSFNSQINPNNNHVDEAQFNWTKKTQ